MTETKNTPSFVIKAASEGRTVAGVCSIFGNIDDWRDRMHPGSFTKTISEGRKRAKHLWNHNSYQPPIASITELKEIGKDELPPEVLVYAPEATGGLYVARDYYPNNELAEWVFDAIKRGDIDEMSFAFVPLKFDYSNENDVQIRELREVKLMDTSDVPWGMNDSTVANIKSLLGMDPDIYLKQLPLAIRDYKENLKSGRRNAAADMALIKSIHSAVIDLGFDGCADLPPNEDDKNEKSKEAEAVDNDTSLTNYLAVASLELESLTM